MKILLLLTLFLLATLLPHGKASEDVWPRHANPIFAQAIKSIPYAQEFRELYPDATMDLSPSSKPDTLYIDLTTGLYQRYLVSLSIPIKLTADRNAIASWNEPHFEVYDVGEIAVEEDDQGYTTKGDSEQKLNYDQFKTLKERGGDFSAIGINLIQDQPVKDFDRAWRPGHPDYVLRASTFSPRKRYGVQLLIEYPWGLEDKEDRKNRLVEVGSERVVAMIDADPGYNRHLNHHVVSPPRWSPDESLLLWKVDGKWNPDALVLVKIHDGRQAWQLNVLTTGQQALLRRTKTAAPKKYLAAKKANAGNGSAFPDGFTVNVTTDGEDGKTVALPLRVYVDLTADPKEGSYPKILESHLDAVVTKEGKFIVKDFRLGSRKSQAN